MSNLDQASLRREDQDPQPRVEFVVSEIATLEALTYCSDYQVVAHADDLPEPLDSLLVEISGSDGAGEGYEFFSTLELQGTEEQRQGLVNYFSYLEMSDSAESLDDSGLQYLLTRDDGYQQIICCSDDGSQVTIKSAGHATIPQTGNLAQRMIRTLNRQDFEFKEAFTKYLDMNKEFLRGVLGYFGQRDAGLTIEIDPEKYLKPEEPTSELVHVPQSDTPRGIRFEDLAGMTTVIQELEGVVWQLQNPDKLAQYGLKRPNGIVLYGPPGNGKTTLVKAFANELGAELKMVDPSKIYGSLMGESEKGLRALLDEAVQTEDPLVLCFDEVDSIIMDRGGSGYQAVRGMLKREIETLAEANPHVVVVAMTNKTPGELDPELFRPGRFDRHIQVGMPTEQSRVEILGKLMVARMDLPRFDEGPGAVNGDALFEVFDLEPFARHTDGFSCAELVCVVNLAIELVMNSRERLKVVTPPLSAEGLARVINQYKRNRLL